MFTRREFLGRSAASLSAISLHGCMPGLFAQAAEAAAKADQTDRVLVVIELSGGNDGLNTLIPFENDLYYKNRPTLAIDKKEVLRLNDQLGLHPGLKPLDELFRQGKLAIVQGVGYPEPDRSHFRSMEIWHTASTGRIPSHTGWLGRYLDQQPKAALANALSGVALTDSLPDALQAERFVPPVVSSLDALTSAEEDTRVPLALLRELSKPTGSAADPASFVGQQAESSFQIARQLERAMADYKSTVDYGDTGLAGQLRRASQIIGGKLGTRVLFASQGGYDTHSAQADAHRALLVELAGALAAFQQDLERLGHADKVVTMVFSEFGRRVDENSSRGTDHGAASNMFLLGGKVKGGLSGSYPSLEKLGDGDLVYNTDFRSVYATVLDRWLGAPSAGVLQGSFKSLDVL
jgi:uncharacterized protein (DUF1501 family)